MYYCTDKNGHVAGTGNDNFFNTTHTGINSNYSNNNNPNDSNNNNDDNSRNYQNKNICNLADKSISISAKKNDLNLVWPFALSPATNTNTNSTCIKFLNSNIGKLQQTDRQTDRQTD